MGSSVQKDKLRNRKRRKAKFYTFEDHNLLYYTINIFKIQGGNSIFYKISDISIQKFIICFQNIKEVCKKSIVSIDKQQNLYYNIHYINFHYKELVFLSWIVAVLVYS